MNLWLMRGLFTAGYLFVVASGICSLTQTGCIQNPRYRKIAIAAILTFLMVCAYAYYYTITEGIVNEYT